MKSKTIKKNYSLTELVWDEDKKQFLKFNNNTAVKPIPAGKPIVIRPSDYIGLLSLEEGVGVNEALNSVLKPLADKNGVNAYCKHTYSSCLMSEYKQFELQGETIYQFYKI